MKKLFAGLIVAALLTALFSGLSLAVEEGNEPAPHYARVTGTVTDINEYYGTDDKPVEGWFFISAEDDNGDPFTLRVTDETCYPFETEINVGDIVTGYYPAGIPMIMIYPAQYPIDVLVSGAPDSQFITVDRFSAWEDGPDGVIISKDGMLALNIGDSTEIVSVDGELFGGSLDGRDLVVIYDISTRSIPAQTTPLKVIVFPEDVSETDLSASGLETPIFVNGSELDTPPAYTDESGMVMVPLRAIAEALGFTVVWNGEDHSVELDGRITLAIGSNECLDEDKSITLVTAPVLRDDFTYVPLNFFKAVAGMNNAYFFEGQIVIDRDGEIME